MVKEGQLILVLLATASLISAVAIGNTKRSHENEAGHHDDKEDHHGGIKMGVSNDLCDNAKFNLDVDWDNSTNYEYTCQSDETTIPRHVVNSEDSCVPKEKIPWPIHKCMKDEIHYEERIPIGGSHRPLWPVYGEYQYVPPQRWLHSMEHGAAVFLYHPCANSEEIEALKSLARRCLRRHIISPSRRLTIEQPFAVVTWGCKLLMTSVDLPAIVKFVRAHAIQTEERTVTEHGQYDLGLLKKADDVSGLMDENICPNIDLQRKTSGLKLTAEDMKEHVPFVPL